MASRRSRAAHISIIPTKQVIARAAQVMMVTVALALFMMSKTGNPAVNTLRQSLADGIAPVLEFSISPLETISNATAWLHEMAALRAENVALKNKNLQLMQWQSTARDLESENQALRALIHVVPPPKSTFITVHIVSDLGGPYVRAALLSGGTEQGVKKDQAVVNESGLVGRVVDAGKTSARVLLLSDINSRVPVMIERTHEKSILMGHNDGLPTLSYLPADHTAEVGERVVTSGDGGIFPAGIEVGVISSIDKGVIKVQPMVDPTRVDYVNVIDFSL